MILERTVDVTQGLVETHSRGVLLRTHVTHPLVVQTQSVMKTGPDRLFAAVEEDTKATPHQTRDAKQNACETQIARELWLALRRSAQKCAEVLRRALILVQEPVVYLWFVKFRITISSAAVHQAPLEIHFLGAASNQLLRSPQDLRTLAIPHPVVQMPNVDNRVDRPSANASETIRETLLSDVSQNVFSALIALKTRPASTPSVKTLALELVELMPNAKFQTTTPYVNVMRVTLEIHLHSAL